MYTLEMGFALVAEIMIENCKKKPLIGHNQIYDILYFYNQFIDDLPATYLEFIKIWTDMFQMNYDSKILAFKN